MNNKLIAASALALALFAQPALAATLEDDLEVSVTVEASCTISTTPVAFGTIGTLTTGTVREVTGTINVTCTSDAPYYITLDDGLHFATGSRQLQNDGATNEFLTYSLFTTEEKTVEWGDQVGEDTVSATGTNNSRQHDVYATLDANQPVSLGVYTDTVVATVVY